MRKHLGRRRDLLTELHGAAHDVAGDRRNNLRPSGSQPCRAHAGLGLQDPRVILRSRADDLSASAGEICLRLIEQRTGIVNRVLIVDDRLGRDPVNGENRAVAIEILRRLRQVESVPPLPRRRRALLE